MHLGHYVYALVDPRGPKPSIFYVGKASANNRAFDHFHAGKDEAKKYRRLRDIRASGCEPIVEILRYGLASAKDALEVEAAIIDALGIENLVNKVRGHGIVRGRQKASEVERLHASKPIAVETIREPYMLFFITKTYSPTKNELELYDCVRQFWSRVSPQTRTPSPESGKFRYPVALGVVDSVVVRAYSVAAWFPAGTTLSTRKSADLQDRWEFVGQLLEGHQLVGHRLTKEGRDVPANQFGWGYHNRDHGATLPVGVLVFVNLAMKSFSELTGKEKSTELRRWLCVPAAAVLGVLALRIIAGFVMLSALAHRCRLNPQHALAAERLRGQNGHRTATVISSQSGMRS